MEILTSLGVDWKLLIAQMVNFAILFYALHRLLYGPITKALEGRTTKIEKGLEDARIAEEKLQLSDATYKEMVRKAKHNAEKILEEASALADQKRTETLKKTREEVKRVVAQAKARIELEKNQMIEDVRKDMVDLVISASQTITKGVSDKKTTRELAKKAIDVLKKKT